MKNKFLDEHPDILLAILNISEIEGIEISNVKSIELGGRSFCYTCKGTSLGDLFIKIDMDLESFSSIDSFRESDSKRKQQIPNLLQLYSKKNSEIAKPFYESKIPASIGKEIPQELMGKSISFSQMIKEGEKKLKTALVNPTIYQKHCMKFYQLPDIEKMFLQIGKFHSFFHKKPDIIGDIEPFFQLIVENSSTLQQKLSKVGIDMNKLPSKEFFDNIFTKIKKTFFEVDHQDIKISDDIKTCLTKLTETYATNIQKKI
jgi:hypothetical protein